MKKIILILFLSAPTSFLFCQDLKVIYSISDLVSVNEIHTFIYKEYSISKFKSAFPKNGDNQQIEHINNRLKTDSIYNIKLYKEKIILHPVESPWDENILVVKDSLNNISWNYSNESQNSSLKILNKNVKKAYCMFRGREYEVFYTPEIPISEGPFKFFGLPGLILKVVSKDQEIIMEAKEIILLKKQKLIIPLKYQNPNSINFWDYVELEKRIISEKIKEYISKLPIEPQSLIKVDFKFGRIENVY